jgi:hypothetical protein
MGNKVKRHKTTTEFFALIKAGLWSDNESTDIRKHRFSEFIDWERLYKLAEEQSVIGVVLAGIERLKNDIPNLNIPQEILLQWIGEVQMLEQQNKAMNHFIAELVEKLRKADIYTLLVKGQSIAQCYEKPLWRACGDVDFFLSDPNYEKAKKSLAPLASSVDKEGVYGQHLGMTIDQWVVELHGSMRCGLSEKMDCLLDEVQKTVFCEGAVRSWMNDKTQIFLPDANSDVIFVFTHFLKHFYKGGVGLRQICDWCRLLWTYKDSLNHGLLESRIMKAGLMTEWKAFAAFAVEYLGMPVEAIPLYSADAKWKRKADRICSFILEVGNFGNKRDMSYFKEKSYLLQKVISLGRRCGDLWRHSMIFPVDSVKFFPRIMLNGLMSAVRGE